MSKETKFLSIGIGLVQGRARREGRTERYADMHAEDVWAAMEEWEAQKGLKQAKNAQDIQTGRACIRVTDEQERGIAAQVKFFGVRRGECAQPYDRVNGRIDMIREITGYDGVLTCELPQGEYALEVSKGSEYSVEEGMLTIRAGEELSLIHI